MPGRWGSKGVGPHQLRRRELERLAARNTPARPMLASTHEVGSGTALTWIRYGPLPGAGVNDGLFQVTPPSVLLLNRGRVPVRSY